MGFLGVYGWSLSQLRQTAAKHKIIVCILQPNLEGLLLRLMAGNENLQPSAATVQQQLRKVWSSYKKPADARTLAAKFCLSDLFRVARVDVELKKIIGNNRALLIRSILFLSPKPLTNFYKANQR